MRIYFDNASTTPLLPEVQEAMIKVIKEDYGNPSSIHLLGRKSRIIVEESRKIIAHGLNASTGEIFFTSGATEANNMAFLGCVNDLGVKRIITTEIEHHCILHMLDQLSLHNSTEVVVLKVDKGGNIDLSELETLLNSSDIKTLVSIMHGNNEIGTIADIKAISALCQINGALFHTDTAQTMGKVPIDLSEINVSFLCGASHKFFGPKGTGFIYINGDNIIKPMMHGGDQERGMRSGTENIYGIAGMAKAYSLAIEQMEDRHHYIQDLKSYFRDRLTAELEDIQFNSTLGGLHHILSVSFPQSPKSEMLMMNLDIAGISASSGSACSSGVENDSHVLQAIGHDPKRKTVRFSFSHLNTKAEVDQVIAELKKITPALQAV